MKTYNVIPNQDGQDIVHLWGDRDLYEVTESNGKLNYVSESLQRTYVVDGNESLYFKQTDGQGKTKYTFDGEYNIYGVQASCKAWLENGYTTSGVYKIDPTGNNPFDVWCDMETDGGGWTIITNNPATVTPIINSGHIPRPTAYPSHVGSTGGVSASDYYSINSEGLEFTEMVHTAYQTSYNNIVGYAAHKWNSTQTIPTTETWDKIADTFDYIFSDLGDKRIQQTYAAGDGNKYVGVWNPTAGSYIGLGTGAGGMYYPTFAHGWKKDTILRYSISFTDAGATTSSTNSSVGLDDWQDGSGCGDKWTIGGVANAYRGTSSFIMVR